MLKNLITQVGPSACAETMQHHTLHINDFSSSTSMLGFMKLKIKLTKLPASLQTFQCNQYCHSQHLRNMYKLKQGNSYALKYH